MFLPLITSQRRRRCSSNASPRPSRPYHVTANPLSPSFVKSLCPHVDFKQNNAGHIVQLGSIAGREGYSGGSIYCATKHALRGFTVALMKELFDTPIRVTEIQPGMVETCQSYFLRTRARRSGRTTLTPGLFLFPTLSHLDQRSLLDHPIQRRRTGREKGVRGLSTVDGGRRRGGYRLGR
jgi:NAD(P)-dependent dehydrogenase (short-subunit alcohol dehydrogenase family)